MAKYKDNDDVSHACHNSRSKGGLAQQLVSDKQQQQQQQQQPAALPEQQPEQRQAGLVQQGQGDGTQQQQRQVPRLIMRTCFFDDAALAAVGAPPARAVRCLQPFLQHLAEHSLPPCKQVVLLGSGMDTRPWRLSLPPNVAWFEVDRRDVLSAKRTELSRSGVRFTAAAAPAAAGSSNSGIGLQAASWSCVAADLQLPGWTAELLAAGLDPKVPTAWLAEGVLYYMDPGCVGGMLQEAASVSAPGSLFAGNFLTADGLPLLQRKSGSTAVAAAGPTSAAGAAIPASEATSAGIAASAAGKHEPVHDASTAGSSSRPERSGLMSQFKWGCPDNVEEFFSEQGWRMLVRHSWQQAAGKYGWEPEVATGSRGRPDSQQVQFAVSVVAQ